MASGENLSVGQYKITITAIITYAYSKGYEDAARTIKAGYVIHPVIPVKQIAHKEATASESGGVLVSTSELDDLFSKVNECDRAKG